ncbi:MAG: type II secretion system F family protein [Candidatus Aenigmarchaeota archaeon]|nr:type II secretion system F family protein [Candidatus Aenigmarchaeota archaeon]
MKRLPFLFLHPDRGKSLAHHFQGFGETASHLFPGADFSLQQAEVDMDAKEWLGLAFFAGVIYFVIGFSALLVATFPLISPPARAFGLAFGGGAGVGGAVFFYFSLYPKMALKKKIKDLEHNLPHALNHLLIQVRAGVTLFNALHSISLSGYGTLSEEFGKAVSQITTGKSDVEAIETIARNNPSLFFRRIAWQMVNALKSGADIGNVLTEIVSAIADEQKTAIKKYGSELNPLSLFYMMLVVIFPTMGIVFLLVLFSFVGAAIDVYVILYGILALILLVQVMFMGLIKNKRPIGL